MLSEEERKQIVKGAERMNAYIDKMIADGLVGHDMLFIIFRMYSILLRQFGGSVNLQEIVCSLLDFAEQINLKEAKSDDDVH